MRSSGLQRSRVSTSAAAAELPRPTEAVRPGLNLVHIVQRLSLARDLPTVMEIVRVAARELTGADGATFVLREGDKCHYADENAISPLWKGKRFPLNTCVSGWVMAHRVAAVIPDIYGDDRVPVEAYRPTFVKSMAMVPIRREAPIGAIGNYWAEPHTATPDEIELLQALADSTSIALENIQLYSELERRVQQRTSELEVANRELESFSYTAAHDLRAPARHIAGFAEFLAEDAHDPQMVQQHAKRIQDAAYRLGAIIDDSLNLARISQLPLRLEPTDLSKMAADILGALAAADREHQVAWSVEPELTASCDPGLTRLALENLLGNAWKFSARIAAPQIAFGAVRNGSPVQFFVRDNGAGFNAAKAAKLFQPFQRYHSDSEFSGSGIGLATVQRIVAKHGGKIEAESAPNAGATFRFTLEPAAA